MNPERLRLLGDRFHALVELPLEERETRLRDLARADAGLAADLRSLLRADDAAADTLAPLPADLGVDASSGGVLVPGARAGPYAIVRLLDSGGMGDVYEAQADHPRRRVALKVLRTAWLGERELRRFEFEAEVLARLQHPNIAVVLESGMHTVGTTRLPWIAMELLEGARDVRTFSREQGLALRERVALFLQACEAVAHGHEKGVIHRDLKPGNLLVDATGRLKVIDFGIARADDAGRVELTQTGEVFGTIRYMAPEQLEGLSRADARSDVYSLGVVLYELAVGRSPFQIDGLTASQAAVAIGGDRDATQRFPRSVPRDLGWIAGRAAHPDPDRRYASVHALCEDLSRWLAGAPVEAGPPSARYRMSKFARRHRAVVGSALVVFAVLVAAILGISESYAKVREERDRVLLLADSRELEQLRARAKHLWPVGPALVGPLRKWLADASEIERRRRFHERAAEQLAAIEAPTNEESWEQEASAQLLTSFDDLFGADGTRASVERRLQRAETLVDSTIAGAEARARWDEAIAYAAGSPWYVDTSLAPQLGLLPIGPDPETGLLEFVDVETGAVPTRGPGGMLRLDTETGVVLVLLPGGDAELGPPEADVAALMSMLEDEEEAPPRFTVFLRPFFLAKHELTVAQWRRMEGEARRASSHGMEPATGMDWFEARRVLLQHRLDLPTEAQWEYAAWGPNPRDAASLPDGRMAFSVDTSASAQPVDRAEPGPFGLRGLFDNASEWCLDAAGGEVTAREPGTGLSLRPETDARVNRGGSYQTTAKEPTLLDRPWVHFQQAATARFDWLGIRPARAVVKAQ